MWGSDFLDRGIDVTKDLGTRMKEYEAVTQNYLIRRMPVIVRVDGKAFHTFTRGFLKPWDNRMEQAMEHTALSLCKIMQNCKLAYFQSDEISFLLTDYNTLITDAWFGNNVQKIVSISSAYASVLFTEVFRNTSTHRGNAVFDSRAFNLTKEEVNNYFVFRQQDAVRNSIQGLGQAHFSPKQLHGVSCNKIQEKLWAEKGINWNDIATRHKRGTCIVKTADGWAVDKEIPTFTQDKSYIEKHVFVGD